MRARHGARAILARSRPAISSRSDVHDANLDERVVKTSGEGAK